MLGPLQLLVVGFDEDKYARDIVLELKKLRQARTIRLFDLLYLFKHEDGSLDSKEVSDLASEEQREFGNVIKSLLGLAAQNVEHIGAQEVANVLNTADSQFGISESELKGIADQLPNGSSAILVIFEHVWARAVKAAMIQSGGKLVAQGFIDPDTLKVATNELAVVLDAVGKSESAAMDQLVDVKVEAKSQEEEALAKAAEAVAEAERREKAALAALAAAELREQEANRAVTEAKAQEEAAQQHAAEVEAKYQEMEDAAFDQVEAVRRAAKRQEEKAMAEAAEVERKAKEIEARAVLRAVNAMVNANVINQQSAKEALNAVIAAQIIEASAAREAATSLSKK